MSIRLWIKKCNSNPLSKGGAMGDLKGISQNLDNGSKNSENQKKDGVRPKIAQNSPFV